MLLYIWNHEIATARSIRPCLNTTAGLAGGDSNSDLGNWCNFVCGLCCPNLAYVCLVWTCKYNTITQTDVNQLGAGRARTGSCAGSTVLVLCWIDAPPGSWCAPGVLMRPRGPDAPVSSWRESMKQGFSSPSRIWIRRNGQSYPK